MIKSFCFLLVYFMMSIHVGFAQSVTAAPADLFIIDSKVLSEKCKVFLYLPENYNSTTQRYPVVYVLDGEYYSSFTADASTLLAQNQLAPNCIVIGITSNNRQRDFSPALDEDSGQPEDLKTA
ncbi:MAG: alpha/beta hydrolase-fold protein, partial [Chitinophagales bacterium]